MATRKAAKRPARRGGFRSSAYGRGAASRMAADLARRAGLSGRGVTRSSAK